ncbi:hypothetical protein D1007_35525 [Hordeum vulgare]|nr:hypothetical protein D1007_35525 [Hordeum vulgare]
MLHTVLEHIKRGNESSLEYPIPSLSRRSDSPWLPRRMEPSSSSSSVSRSSDTTAPLVAVKPELQETLLHRHSCDNNLVINEGRRDPSPTRPLSRGQAKEEDDDRGQA